MTWDVTVAVWSLAESYLASTSTIAGAAAEGAASRKDLKYQSLASTHTFIPLVFETLGPINTKGISFLNELGHRLSARTSEPRETAFLFQRISIAVQRFNPPIAILFLHTNYAIGWGSNLPPPPEVSQVLE